MSLQFPEEAVGEAFPRPPSRIIDEKRRRIKLERAETGDVESLVDMYTAFRSKDRAQGIPPSGESNIREWLEVVMAEKSLNVIAWHKRDAIGHAMLVNDTNGNYEFAIFIDEEYRGAGVGTGLMKTTLGAAQKRGIQRVWLTVERSNEAAIRLYEKLGFQRMGDENFEIEMTIRLTTEYD